MESIGLPRYRASTAAVLEFAWDAGPFRADHVMAACDITRSTTLVALDTLIEIGLIRELASSGAEEGSRLGRPARRFELRGEAGLIVGVDAGDRHFTASAADLTGRVLGTAHLDVRGYHKVPGIAWVDADPKERHEAALQAIDDVLVLAGARREDVLGVSVGVPAPVDGQGRSPDHPTGFWQHMNAGLQDALSEFFPAVRVENDAALAAVAEATLGEALGVDHFVAMLSGRRLGAGVVLEGQLVRGAYGGVGELEALAFVAGVGGTWGFGDLAVTWLRRAQSDGLVPAGHPWARLGPEDLTGAAVFAHAKLSDPVSRPLLEELGGTLGRICSVLARFYDPETIVVCGATASAMGEVIEVARRHVESEAERTPPEVVASTLGGEVVSLGAVSAAREMASEIVLPLLTERLRRRD